MGEIKKGTQFWFGSLRGRSPFRRPKRRLQKNIKVDLMEIEGMDKVNQTQDRDRSRAVVNTEMEFLIP
jgi:hypothetical protein